MDEKGKGVTLGRLEALMFIGICNPDALNIRIFNPIIALQMLIFNAAGYQDF